MNDNKDASEKDKLISAHDYYVLVGLASASHEPLDQVILRAVLRRVKEKNS